MKKGLIVVGMGLMFFAWSKMGVCFDEKDVLFYVPFEKSVYARVARGNGNALIRDADKIFGFAKGKIGEAVVFGKTEAHLEYSLAKNLNKESGTICFWVCPNFDEVEKTEGYKILLSFGGESPIYLNLGYGANYSYKLLSFILCQQGKWQYLPNLNADAWESGAWHHIAVTWAEGNRNLYVDGVLAGGETYVEPLPAGGVMTVGSLPGYKDKYFKGKLDELYIFPRAMDEKEIQQIYKLDKWGVAESAVSQPKQAKDGILSIDMGAESWYAGDDAVEISNDVDQVVEGEKSLKIKISHNKRPQGAATITLKSPPLDLSEYTTLDLWVYVTSTDPNIKKGRFVVLFIEAGFPGQQFKSHADLDYVPVDKWVRKSIDISSFQRTCITGVVPHFYFQGTLPSPAIMTWYFDNMVLKVKGGEMAGKKTS